MNGVVFAQSPLRAFIRTPLRARQTRGPCEWPKRIDSNYTMAWVSYHAIRSLQFDFDYLNGVITQGTSVVLMDGRSYSVSATTTPYFLSLYKYLAFGTLYFSQGAKYYDIYTTLHDTSGYDVRKPFQPYPPGAPTFPLPDGTPFDMYGTPCEATILTPNYIPLDPVGATLLPRGTWNIDWEWSNSGCLMISEFIKGIYRTDPAPNEYLRVAGNVGKLRLWTCEGVRGFQDNPTIYNSHTDYPSCLPDVRADSGVWQNPDHKYYMDLDLNSLGGSGTLYSGPWCYGMLSLEAPQNQINQPRPSFPSEPINPTPPQTGHAHLTIIAQKA